MSDSSHSDIVRFRRELHAHPELSEDESATATRIVTRLRSLAPTNIVEGLGVMETGVCAVFDSGRPGPTVLLRSELDALPIVERNTFAHRSITEGVSHKCGHDGHMATLVAVAESLAESPPGCGRVYLLFQPAEETGTGARSVLEDERFRALPPPDYVYAFHNVPKFPLGRVLLRDGVFAQGSVGFIVRLRGRTSHSSYPEHGINPTEAMTGIISGVGRLAETLSGETTAPVLGTINFARLGSEDAGPNFGVAPGEATIAGVLRGWDGRDLECARNEVTRLAADHAAAHGLEQTLSWHEAFAPTRATPECTAVLAAAAGDTGLEVSRMDEPFRWSEDFGYFTEAFAGAFFGLGSGTEQPQLHDDRYDYPDELIDLGARLYRAVIDRHLAG